MFTSSYKTSLILYTKPLIETLDAYEQERSSERGRSIVKLLKGVLYLTRSSLPKPLPVAQIDRARLELLVKSNNSPQKQARPSLQKSKH